MSAAGAENYQGQDLEALADLHHYYRWIMRFFGQHLRGRVLELGAGIGNFTSHYIDQAHDLTLIEPAANLAPQLARRFADRPGVQVHNGLLEQVERSLQPHSYDAVVLVNVLEHIEDDQGTIASLGRLLRPDGRLLVFVPALRWLFGSLDQAVCHYRRYGQSRLRRIVHRAGLHMETLRYFDAVGIVPWWLMGRVLRMQTFQPGASWIYDRLVVPLAAPLERLVRPPLGKNLVCISRKPGQAETRRLAA